MATLRGFEFTQDDGGEWAYTGPGKMTGSCGPRAVAIALGISFTKAVKLLKGGLTSDPTACTYKFDLDSRLTALGWEYISTTEAPPRGSTVIVWCSHHFAAIKDGIVRDGWDSRRMRVKGYWINPNASTVRSAARAGVGLKSAPVAVRTALSVDAKQAKKVVREWRKSLCVCGGKCTEKTCPESVMVHRGFLTRSIPLITDTFTARQLAVHLDAGTEILEAMDRLAFEFEASR